MLGAPAAYLRQLAAVVLVAARVLRLEGDGVRERDRLLRVRQVVRQRLGLLRGAADGSRAWSGSGCQGSLRGSGRATASVEQIADVQCHRRRQSCVLPQTRGVLQHNQR